MSCDTVGQLDKYHEAVQEQALRVDVGLITFEEAKRAIFGS